MNWFGHELEAYTYSYKPGDVVRLKTGGPDMSVHYEISPMASMNTGHRLGVHCDWIDAAGRPHTAVYFPEQLTPLPNH